MNTFSFFRCRELPLGNWVCNHNDDDGSSDDDNNSTYDISLDSCPTARLSYNMPS